MKSNRGNGPFLALAPHCALKRLETPSLYDIRADELYELDDEAFSFLASCPPVAAASHTPEDDPPGGNSGLQSSKKLSPAHDIRTCPQPGQPIQES